MARHNRVYTVLVACPGDVQHEVEAVRKVVEGINRGLGRLQTATLEVVGWKTHAGPGVGADPQEVLNRQLPEDYDIFLGVMWARFGTATPRAGSGTEEEFRRALARHNHGDDNLRIMFYFKEAALSPNDIDGDQLEKVKAFRKQLADDGLLYGTFATSSEFEATVREHLTQQFLDLTKPATAPDESGGAVVGNEVPEREEDTEELGYMSLLKQVWVGGNAPGRSVPSQEPPRSRPPLRSGDRARQAHAPTAGCASGVKRRVDGRDVIVQDGPQGP